MTLYLAVTVFLNFRVCAVVHAEWVCALPRMFLLSVAAGSFISQSLPAKSVAGPGYGPLVLILAQMIDSPGAETTDSALWLAINTLRVTPCHQERKGRGKKARKETGEGVFGTTGRKRESRIKRKKAMKCGASCQNALYQFWQTKTSELSVNM